MSISQHQALHPVINENEQEQGSALLLSQSPDKFQIVGTVDTPDLVDFLETFFRMSPETREVFQYAIDRSQCQNHMQ